MQKSPTAVIPVGYRSGMRHRAALGVSEESDAIVVVVSEETGAISVFHNAKVRAGLSATELKAELIRLNSEEQQTEQPPQQQCEVADATSSGGATENESESADNR